MPKALQNETCRADTKKSHSHNHNSLPVNAKKSATVANKVARTAEKFTKAKSSPKAKVPKTPTSLLVDHEKKVKTKKIAVAAKLLVKKKPSPTKKEANATSKPKVKEKPNMAPKSKTKQKETKKPPNVVANPVVAKKEAKKPKSDSAKAITAEMNLENSKPAVTETHSGSIPLILPPKKEVKKRKEHADAFEMKETKKLAKVLIAEKKEQQKPTAEKSEKDTKVTKITEMDEKCMAPKKRLKQKCAKDAAIAAADAKREAELKEKEMANQLAETQERKNQSQNQKNVKFFKSKSKKQEKPKELPSNQKSKDEDMKEAFAVYDNFDEDSEELSKPIKKKTASATKSKTTKVTKEPAEPKVKQPTKPKNAKNSEKAEKRKLDPEYDNEIAPVKVKKQKRMVADESAQPEPKIKAKKAAAKPVLVKKNFDVSASSSDDAPLNRLITKSKGENNTKSRTQNAKNARVKVEPNSGASDTDVKPAKKSKAKSAAKTTPPPKAKVIKSSEDCSKKTNKASNESKSVDTKGKKSVRFSKAASPKPVAKPVRERNQRMASLNAMAMVHCMYENEGKNVSVSSFESTEVSDDNTAEIKNIQEAESKPKLFDIKEELKEMAVVKYDPHVGSAEAVISRESLRSAPGVRSIGKHWDMNSETISSDVEQEIVRNQQVVIEEVDSLDKPKNALRKKFARALRAHVSEDSSEEDKHQALLMEEKQRMMRRRRRQRKEMTMDLKDMVVCKRMASLNATAILAASYSSTTGKRTLTVKSNGKEEKNENVENFEKTESLITKIKGRGKVPFIRKKFSSSSDADVEDEADVSSNEVVVKASSSGKQLSLIVNQDSGVTITGLYLNSTTKSTHRQGYCSISGMQYRISSTSHTQTEATTVTSEPAARTPQEPHRPPVPVALHPERQMSPPRNVAMPSAHPSPLKTYTPLNALSNMQPPGSPHHVHHLHHHPKTVTISSTQISSLERHGCPSAFSTPAVYGPPPPPPPLATVATRPPYPLISKTPPDPAFVTGYYQPAGPLISHHHHHHHHHHHVQQPAGSTTATSTAASSATVTSAPPSASTISFSKVSQSPLVQPPTPPASNVTQPVSENSDNEMASATTPAAEITVSESTHDDNNYPLDYRFGASVNPAPPFRSPSQNYQHYYPSPPSTASLPHPQQQHFQEVMYNPNPPPGPPGPFHLGYLQPKGPPHHPPLQRRYIPALPPHQQYYHHEYSASAPTSQQQVVMPAHHPLTSTADYHSVPPTPSIIETYPPPPPPPLYYPGYAGGPPASYYPYAASSRSLTLVETSCPCPLQGCQKNVHTGPLTGISKGPVKHNTPLSPVALSLPKEPQDIRSLPSPARGSAGARPTPSPAIATAKHPSSWNEGSDCGYDTAGLLTISKSSNDSIADVDSGIDGSTETSPTKTRRRSSSKKQKTCKFKSRKSVKQVCNSDEEFAKMHSTYYNVIENADSVGVMSATTVTEFVSRIKPVEMNADVCDSAEEQMDELVAEGHCTKQWSGDEVSEPEMPKLYPEVSPPPCNKRTGCSILDEDLFVKRAKMQDECELVDVEKNNYLSALELCSVSNVAENLAPLRQLGEQQVKIVGKSESGTSEELNASRVAVEAGAREEWQDNSSGVGSSSSPRCSSSATPVESKKPRFRKRRWTTKKKKKKKKKSNKSTRGGSEEEKLEAENAEKRRRAELLSLSQKRAVNRLKWSNGWAWLGEPFVAKVFLNTEGQEVLRTCYPAMKHQSGDIIRSKDCILLRSGCKKTDLPYIAKVAHLWEDPEDGEMMMSLFWYYRPEHTEHDTIHSESPFELYASKHKDVNSVACIEDKCYVLTFNEYCRYHKSIRQAAESVDVSSVIVPPLAKKRYPRQALLPPENTSLDLVFFCRKIYDFRQHRLLKNPFFV